MATSEQIDAFIRFAKQISEQEGADLPLDAIFDRWHEEAYREEDLHAIQASAHDYEHGGLPWLAIDG